MLSDSESQWLTNEEVDLSKEDWVTAMLAYRLTLRAVRESMVDKLRRRSFERRSGDVYVGLLSDSASCAIVHA